jgi:outer membrane translocation and assembly module TamA
MVKYLRENQSASSGMPMPLATGAGEATNRSTLNNMQNLMEFTLNDIAKRTAASITKYILKPVAGSKGLKTYPKMIPNKVNIDEIDDFAIRMNNYVKNGNLLPEDVRDLILKMEGIIIDEETEEKRKEQKKEEEKKEEEKKEEEEKDKEDFERNENLSEGEWKVTQV